MDASMATAKPLYIWNVVQKNKASTVLQYFEQGVQESGFPFRVQGDQGIENVDVARYMLINQGSDRGSFIVDTSAHNQHI